MPVVEGYVDDIDLGPGFSVWSEFTSIWINGQKQPDSYVERANFLLRLWYASHGQPKLLPERCP